MLYTVSNPYKSFFISNIYSIFFWIIELAPLYIIINIFYCSICSGEESEEVKDAVEETPRDVEDEQDATMLSDQEESDEDEDEQEQGKLNQIMK